MEQQFPVDKTGLYLIESKEQTVPKPIHLEKRLNHKRNSNHSNNKQEVESKREAILEERRKRLNQNFQKVKRIAKEMKARQEDKINLLSKSMALAESNRNRHIEKRRNASKQTVERAKYIALQNQYRSQQEQERRRAELESRFEKNEQRRLAHLSRKQQQQQQRKKAATTDALVTPMSTVTITTPSSPVVTVEEPVAPKKKPSSWSIILKAFRELGLPLPSDSSTWLEFNALGALLNQPKVIVVTTKILNTALKLNDEDSRQRARVLLTSYMTLMCPREVLQNVEGVEEKRLHGAAKEMLHLFETWLKAHGRPGATAARLAFVQAWNEYTVLFEAWKSSDCDQLVQNMIVYYVELSTLRQTVIAQGDADEVGTQLQQQLDGIKTKLQKLGGSNALNELQRALESSASSTSTGRKKQQQNNTPRSPVQEDKFKNTAYTEQHGEQMGQILNSFVPDSGLLTNYQLAHELILDPEFKLSKQEEPMNDLQKRVRMMAEKAFFDKVAQDIQEGHPELSLPSLINDVKTRLLALVRPGTSMYNSIDEAMDVGLMEQQMKKHSFDITGILNYVIDMMSKMCAPVRDAEIQALQSLEAIEQIKRILNLLEEMSLDLANFRLRSLRPHLMTIAVEYEREQFASLLNNGDIQLVRTKAWLNESTDKLCQVAAQRNPEGIRPEKNNKPTHDAVFEEAFISLLLQPKVIESREDLPETLFLDVRRMSEFQNEIQAITIVGSLLMLARNFGGTSNPTTLSQLGNRLFTMLEDPTTSIENLSTEIVERASVSVTRKEMIRTMVEKTISHSDTVYSLLSRRIGTILKSTIQNNKFVTDAVLSSNGLQHVRSQLQSIAHKVLAMTHHHRKVFSIHYDDIITEALGSTNNK